jgi:transcriptional regulator with GAF, ATPase, and Fis domain
MSFQHTFAPETVPELRCLCEILGLSQPQTRLPHLKDYFHQVTGSLSRYFPIGYSALVLKDSQKDSFHVEAFFGMGEEAHPGCCGGQKGIMRKVIENQEPMAIHDLGQEPLYEEWMGGEKQTAKFRLPLLCIPLVAEGEPLGVINIESLYGRRDEFQQDFQFLLVIAAILSPVIKSYQAKKGEPLAKYGKPKLKFSALEEFLSEKVGEVLNKIDPYVEAKAGVGIFGDIVALVEKILIKSALERVDYVQVAAAQLLGINRNTLRKKIKDLKIKNR